MIELIEGQPPPWLIPFCASCDQPVEKFTVLDVKDPYFVDIDAQCHGKTEGFRARIEVLMAHEAGERIVMFKRRRGFDLVR